MNELSQAEILKRKLRWKCRRGMLELDLFLAHFFEKQYDYLSVEEKKAFARFLEVEDTQLYAWFMKIEKPEKDEFLNLVNKITGK